MENCKVSILGTEYTIEFNTEEEEPRLETADGLMDFSVKKICIGIFEPDADSVEDIQAYTRKVLRHEIIHAYFYESGVWDMSGSSEAWARDETITDWFAIQAPKMLKTFQEAGAL
jgi:hypothetical protein